MRELKNR